MARVDVLTDPLSAAQLSRIRAASLGWLILLLLAPLAIAAGSAALGSENGAALGAACLILGFVVLHAGTSGLPKRVTPFYPFAASPIKTEQCALVLDSVSRFPELARYVDAVASQGRMLSAIELSALLSYPDELEKAGRWSKFSRAKPGAAQTLAEARSAAQVRLRKSTKRMLLISMGMLMGGSILAFSLDPHYPLNEMADFARTFAVASTVLGWFGLVAAGASFLVGKRNLFAEVTRDNLAEIAVVEALNPAAFARYAGAVHAQGRELLKSELAGLRDEYVRENREREKLKQKEACARVHSGHVAGGKPAEAR